MDINNNIMTFSEVPLGNYFTFRNKLYLKNSLKSGLYVHLIGEPKEHAFQNNTIVCLYGERNKRNK